MLKQLEIVNLFGQYTYKLPFIAGQRKNICFLTGPNGYGKSTVLQLIAAFMSADTRPFVQIPFDVLTFYLNNYRVVMRQERVELMDKTEDSFSSDEEPIIHRIIIDVYVDCKEEVFERVSFTDGEWPEDGKVFPPSLSVYLASQKMEYLTDDRLWSNREVGKGVVEAVSLLREKMSIFNNQLMIDFNERLMGAMRSLSPQDFAKEQFKQEDLMQRVEEKLAGYHKLGLAKDLMEDKENNEFLNQLRAAAIDQTLSFDAPFYKRLKLLYEIVECADFSYKELVLDNQNGLFFRSGESLIIPEQLSSGEQHFIIQLITLLFKAEKGSLILIDEPELSYHPAWQMDYLKNLRRIAEIGEYQFILATHSAQIFDYHWGYTIDLYKQTIEHEKESPTKYQPAN